MLNPGNDRHGAIWNTCVFGTHAYHLEHCFNRLEGTRYQEQ
jgi:hypothetical protein